MNPLPLNKSLVLLLGLLIPALCVAENLFTNSNMDTTGGWKGDRRFEKVEDNAVISLEAKKNKTSSFSQDVNTAKALGLVLKFRYRTADYAGRGLQLRASRTDGSSTFHDQKLVADDKWHDASWNFSEVRGSNRINFSIELLEGTGKVLFDDVTVEAK